MKLKDKLPEIETRYSKYIIDKEFREWVKNAKETHRYVKDFSTYISATLRDILYRPSEIVSWYKEYQCNDTHVINVFKHFAKERGIIK